jgi:hypothetical protein
VDPAVGVVVQQRGGHLGATGVVDADEQHLGRWFTMLPWTSAYERNRLA